MNFKQSLCILFLIAVVALNGCSKNSSPKPNSTTTTKADTDVYAVGYVIKNHIYYATYWKNGIATTLNNGNVNAIAYSLALSGNDVYIAGTTLASNQIYTAAYWKNGVIHKLADSANVSSATSIAIKNNDVYMTGYENQTGPLESIAIYWKNAVATILPGGTYGAGAGAITLNGNDVYIAGYAENIDRAPLAAYWKNGALTMLPAATINQFSIGYASGIVVGANGVITSGYLVNGYGESKIAYWAGNTLTTNNANVVSSLSYAAALKGNDVYMAGDTLSAIGGIQTAACWKNGTIVNLANGGVGSDAYAIATAGNDIYVGGFYGAHKIQNAPFLGKAVYWKNGATIQLSSDTSNVYGLTIVTH